MHAAGEASGNSVRIFVHNGDMLDEMCDHPGCNVRYIATRMAGKSSACQIAHCKRNRD